MKGFIKKIEQINFGLMSPEDIRAMSVVTVETPDTYEEYVGLAVSEVETVKGISVVLNLQDQLFTLVLVMSFTKYYVPPVMNVAVFF